MPGPSVPYARKGFPCWPWASARSEEFRPDDAVEIAGPDGHVFAKGLARHDAKALAGWVGWQSSRLPPDVPHEVVHRDDLVILP